VFADLKSWLRLTVTPLLMFGVCFDKGCIVCFANLKAEVESNSHSCAMIVVTQCSVEINKQTNKQTTTVRIMSLVETNKQTNKQTNQPANKQACTNQL
jgi:hypothetical protein